MYDYGNYAFTFETGTKRLQEMVIARKIMKNIVSGVSSDYSSYESFKKSNRLNNVMSHFKDSLDDSDFKVILSKFNVSNSYNENNMYSANSQQQQHQKQFGLKTSAGALFKED